MARLETALNGRVYGLFGLTAAEVAVVECTKYRRRQGIFRMGSSFCHASVTLA